MAISEGKKPGSVAMKRKVRSLYEQGFTPKEIAADTGVSRSTIKNWIVDLPKHSTGFSQRPHGTAAARVARLTDREGEAIRQEMEAKENDPCVFCGVRYFFAEGWASSAYHHYEDGRVDRAHKGCNAVRKHTG
jgi:transposase